jgi:hypothetical protein
VQAYPVYLVQATADGEKGMDVELRVQRGAGGGLPGMPTALAVVEALAAAMTAAGAGFVTAVVQDVQTSNVPIA